MTSIPPQLTLEFAEAPARLWSIAQSRLVHQPAILIGITGPVGSGKSTLARLLRESAPPHLRGPIISTDDYLPDYDRVAPLERDLPHHADLSRLAADLSLLKSGGAARIPIWSFQTHRREGEREAAPAAIVICEGIHALHEHPRAHLDLAVFIDAPREVRWARWEAIERAGERGMGVEKARIHFDTIAEPTFAGRSQDYRQCAHIVVKNDLLAPAQAC